jgi:hypothetical protein
MQKTWKWLWPLLWYEVCTNLDPRINGFWILVVLNPFLVHEFDQFCNKSYRTGGTKGTGTVYTFGKPKFTPVFSGGLCCSIFCFLCSVLHRIVCPLSVFFFDNFHCLYIMSFFGFWLLISSLMSSNFS